MDLSDDYVNGAYIPAADGFPPRWAEKAAQSRMDMGARAKLDQPYANRDREKLDLFLPEGEPSGLFVFVHGGYWKAFDKSSWSHLAVGMLARGRAVAMPSYDLCPDVRIAEITRQVASAVRYVASQIDGPISMAGHSAGGHLVARMLDRQILAPEIGQRIDAVIPISPLSDLRPLMQTDMNETLQIDAKEAVAESPVLMTERYPAKTTIWVGSAERPAFLDQASALAKAWSAPCVIDPNKHHFDVIDPLEDPESAMVQTLLS